MGLIAAFLAVVIGGPQLRAQQTGDSGSAAGMNASSKVEKLQKELDALKEQIDQLKKTQEEKKAEPAVAVSEAPAAPAGGFKSPGNYIFIEPAQRTPPADGESDVRLGTAAGGVPAAEGKGPGVY